MITIKKYLIQSAIIILIPARLSKRIIFLLILTGGSVQSSAQTNIDSIISLIKKDKEDTNKVNHLNALGWELKQSNPDTAIILSNQALSIAEKIKWQIGIGNSNRYLGEFNWRKGDYSQALGYYFKALAIWDALERNTDSENVKSLILHRKSSTFGGIGIVYDLQGDYSKALDYYFKALKIAEKLGEKNSIATWLGNIGIVYREQGDYPKALDYYFKALKIAEKLRDKNGIVRHLGNIGVVYMEQGDYPKALDYYFKTLKMVQELGDKRSQAINLGNIGGVYSNQGDYPMALDYYFKALKTNEELGRRNGIAVQLGNIGSLYIKTGKFREAEHYLKRAIAIHDSIGALDFLRHNEESLSELYNTTGRYELALVHYKKAMALKDTIFNEEKNKELTRKEMNFEFEKKEANTKVIQEKKDAIAKEEIKRKEQQRNYFIIGFSLVLLLALFILRGFRQKQKANILISKQKLEVEMKNEIIEEKQKEILDSIRYAKRIQMALLPNKKYIDKSFSRLKNSK